LAETPKTIILDEATQWGADLIVLGSHGRRGAERFLMGSISEAVAMHAHCSVEVVRMKSALQHVESGLEPLRDPITHALIDPQVS
jgi:Universal stress protein family